MDVAGDVNGAEYGQVKDRRLRYLCQFAAPTVRQNLPIQPKQALTMPTAWRARSLAFFVGYYAMLLRPTTQRDHIQLISPCLVGPLRDALQSL